MKGLSKGRYDETFAGEDEQEAAQTRLSLHLSKCHIVGNLMSRLKF